MKNLKKVLSLVLALSMALSLMTVAFAADASDYKDYDKVTHKEAVDVMTAVGVFNGTGDGTNFTPDGTLTREQAAKIITYMLVGQTQADRLVTTIAPYSDVAANRWSAGSIAYCTNAGIIAGTGNGAFNPTAPVTGLEFAKMLLTAIGYDAEIEDLVGPTWAINTATLATATGLDDGLETIALSAALTREQAAQMALNAVKTPLVEYSNKGTTIEVNGATVSFGAQEASYVTTTIAKTQTISSTRLSNSNEYTIEFGEKYMPDLRMLGDTDAFERPATTWRLKNADIGTYADTPDLSYTSAVAIGTIYNDLGLTRGISAADTTVYEDGVLSTSTTTVNGTPTQWTNFDIVKGQTAKIGGDGSLTDVYYDVETGKITIVVVNTYVAEIGGAYAATTTRDAYVTLDITAPYTTPSNGFVNSYDTDEFAKEDVVYYTYSYKSGENCIQSMEKAEAVTGAMSTYTTTGSVTVNGTKYDGNAKSVANIANFMTSVDKGSDVTIYLDAYGYVLYVDADVEVNYAVVVNYAKNAGDFNDTAKAQLLFTDGTTATVEVEFAGTVKDDVNNATGAGTADGLADATNTNNELNKYDIVSYTVDSDDVYTLTLVADSQAGKAGNSFSLTNGINNFSITDGNKANVNGANNTTAADGKTIFLVADTSGDKTTYSAYEGFAAVPTIKHNGGTAGTVAVFAKDGNNTPATVVFIEKTNRMTMISDNEDVIYLKGSNVGTSYTTDLGTFYEYDAFVNGSATATTVKTQNQYTADTLIYGPIYNSKGILTGAQASTGANGTTGSGLVYGTTTESMVNDVIKLGGTNYAYVSNVNVYYVTVDGELLTSNISAIAQDSNDQVFLKLNDKGLLTDVYVKVVDQPTSVTPGSGVLQSVALAKDGSGNLVAGVNLTAAATSAMTFDVSVEKYMESTDKWVNVATGNVTVASGNTAGQSAALIVAASVDTGALYRVTATYANGSMTSANFTA